MLPYHQAVMTMLLGAALSVAAPAPKPTQVGKMVFTRVQNLSIIDDPTAPSPRTLTRSTFLSYRVIAEKEGWIKVRDRTIEGWLARENLATEDEAVAFFTKQIEEKRDDANVLVNGYNSRASARTRKNDFDGAIKDISEAIRLRPNSGILLVNRGLIWAQKKNDDEAMKDYNAGLQMQKGHYVGMVNRAHALQRQQKFDAALADYTEAIAIEPAFAASHHGRGTAWVATKQYDKAIADYTEAIRLNPKYAACLNDRGVAWIAKKEYDKAVADLTEAIKHERQLKAAFLQRGQAWKGKKEYFKALLDLEEATFLDRKYDVAWNHRAWLLATCPDDKIRDGKKAVELATKACELTMWKNASHLSTLAAAHAEAGDFDEAIKAQKKAMEDAAWVKPNETKANERLKLYESKKPYREE